MYKLLVHLQIFELIPLFARAFRLWTQLAFPGRFTAHNALLGVFLHINTSLIYNFSITKKKYKYHILFTLLLASSTAANLYYALTKIYPVIFNKV